MATSCPLTLLAVSLLGCASPGKSLTPDAAAAALPPGWLGAIDPHACPRGARVQARTVLGGTRLLTVVAQTASACVMAFYSEEEMAYLEYRCEVPTDAGLVGFERANNFAGLRFTYPLAQCTVRHRGHLTPDGFVEAVLHAVPTA